MARLTVSRKARRDLANIWSYIARDSIQHADRWLAELYEVFSLLCIHPRMGPSSDSIAPGTRKFPVGNYIIYYRLSGARVQIAHVLHGKRDQRRAFEES